MEFHIDKGKNIFAHCIGGTVFRIILKKLCKSEVIIDDLRNFQTPAGMHLTFKLHLSSPNLFLLVCCFK